MPRKVAFLIISSDNRNFKVVLSLNHCFLRQLLLRLFLPRLHNLSPPPSPGLHVHLILKLDLFLPLSLLLLSQPVLLLTHFKFLLQHALLLPINLQNMICQIGELDRNFSKPIFWLRYLKTLFKNTIILL